MQEKGVKKTTVDELVKRVGIPKGTFYLFYPSKDCLGELNVIIEIFGLILHLEKRILLKPII